MKPGVDMTVLEKPQTLSPSEEKVEQTGWSKKFKYRVIAGLAIFLVVAAVIALSVYFGVKLTQDNFKMARQTFVRDDGKVTEEETTVSKDTVGVKVPNEVEVIYDYVHGLIVERYVNSETKKKSACFAKYMNASQAPSRNSDDYDNNGEVALSSKSNNSSASQQEEQWVSTDRLVPRFLVSESVDRMCKDTDIYWMEKKPIESREKRAAMFLYSKVNLCYKISNYPCLYYCSVTSVYYSSPLYIFVTSWGYYCDVTCARYYAYCT